MAKKDILKEIKDMEDKARQEALSSEPVKKAAKEAPESQAAEAGKVDLDSWYHLRSKSIPAHHMKEIIKADFRARGLSDKETMEAFDKALESYGVKIK